MKVLRNVWPLKILELKLYGPEKGSAIASRIGWLTS